MFLKQANKQMREVVSWTQTRGLQFQSSSLSCRRRQQSS